MKTIWYRVTRLLHPITLAVVLVGVAGFLLGLIVAVERQDAAVIVPTVMIGEVNRIAALEASLASRESDLTELQAELARQRAEDPSATAAADAASQIAGLEVALANSTAELNALQNELNELSGQLAEAIQSRDDLRVQADRARLDNENELNGLSGQLAEAIQSRDDLRAQADRARLDNENELKGLSGQLAEAIQSRDDLRVQADRARLDNENELKGLLAQLAEAIQSRDDLRKEGEQANLDSESERASLEQTISDLRQALNVAQERARAPAPVVAAPGKLPPATALAENPQSVSAEAPAPEPAVADSISSARSAGTSAEETTPVGPSRSEPDEPDQQSAAVPVSAGPVAQGIAAYREADYRKAYKLWLPQALKGSSRAQFYVGALYFEGRGVPTDRVLSYMWLRAATKKDDAGATKLLDRVRESMTGPELVEAETRIANGETIPEQ